MLCILHSGLRKYYQRGSTSGEDGDTHQLFEPQSAPRCDPGQRQTAKAMKSLSALTVNEQVSDAVSLEREGEKVVGAR